MTAVNIFESCFRIFVAKRPTDIDQRASRFISMCGKCMSKVVWRKIFHIEVFSSVFYVIVDRARAFVSQFRASSENVAFFVFVGPR